MERRAFVKSGALALVTMGLSPSFLRRTAFGMELFNAPNLKTQLYNDIHSVHIRLKRLVEGMRQVSADIAHDRETSENPKLPSMIVAASAPVTTVARDTVTPPCNASYARKPSTPT